MDGSNHTEYNVNTLHASGPPRSPGARRVLARHFAASGIYGQCFSTTSARRWRSVPRYCPEKMRGWDTPPYTGPDRVPYFENGTLHHDTLIAHCQSTTLCSVDHCDLVFPLVNGDMLQRSAASCNALSSVQTETRMQMSSVRSEIWRLAILQIRP
jgi:hypothetical protein